MKLLKLELTGFKSFPRKTSLEFHPGITAIVGPNGCGKSNFVDAIRWVLGEQNPRMLRGERMDDAIFKGTATRKPLGLAEVTMTLSNERGELPIAFSEVSLMRRLFKSGESQYMINKSQVRLKDITDLTAGTGIGLVEYSLIDQKLVDVILDTSTSSRRELVEEAAGVAGYKRKRHLARKKLEAVESDLRRIDDIIREVERNVNSLGRHVKKAKRYKHYHDRQEEVDVNLASIKITKLSREEKETADKLRELDEQVVNRKSIVEERTKQIEIAREVTRELEEEARKRRIEIEASRARKNELDGDLRLARERLRITRERLTRLGAERDDLLQKHSSHLEEKEHIKKRISEVELKLTGVKERQNRQDQKTTRLRKQLEEKKIELQTMDQRIEEEYRSSLHEEAQRVSLREQIGGLMRQKSELEPILNGGCGTVENMKEEEGNLSGEIGKLQEIVNKLQAELGETEQQWHELFSRRESCIRTERERELELNNVNARLEIMKAGRKGTGHTEAVDYAIGCGNEIKRPVWKVTDLIAISDDYRVTLQQFLGEYDESIVTEDLETALELISLLREKGIGPVSVLSLDSVVTDTVTPPDITGVRKASNFVECEEQFSPVRDHLFGNVFLVPADADLRNLVELSSTGLLFISSDDSFMVRRGVLTGGRDFRRSGETYDELKTRGDQILKELTQARARFEEVDGTIKDVERGKYRLEMTLQNNTADLQGKEARALQISVELESRKREHDRTRSEHTSIVTMLEEKGSLLRVTEENLSARSARLDELKKVHAKAEEELNALLDAESIERGVLSDLKVDVAALSSRLREVKILNKNMNDQINELEIDLQARDDEEGAIGEKIKALTINISDLENALEIERSRVDSLTEILADVEEKLRRKRREMEDVGVGVEEMRSALEEIYQERNDSLIRKKELSITIEALVRKVEDEYNRKIDVDNVQVLDEDEQKVEELESELADIRRKIHYMGSVNMAALEEYESEKERCDFLTAQRDDLLRSKEDLEQTIRKLNKIARELFRESFSDVRENFTKIFSTLFSGGEAGLELSDPSDPLESEIKIFARPGGKRQQPIEVLSGGERTLAAIAFLFSLYLVKSSPFCVFDEVDAPLDDANILRFTSMLKDYSSRTQFIVITHNKRTMEAADYMYGVSMEELGISKVVSIKLNGNGRKGSQKKKEGIQIVDEVTV